MTNSDQSKKKEDLLDLNALLFQHDLVGIVSIKWKSHQALQREGEFWLSMIGYFNLRGEILINEEIKKDLLKLKENRFHPNEGTVNQILLRNTLSFLEKREYL